MGLLLKSHEQAMGLPRGSLKVTRLALTTSLEPRPTDERHRLKFTRQIDQLSGWIRDWAHNDTETGSTSTMRLARGDALAMTP